MKVIAMVLLIGVLASVAPADNVRPAALQGVGINQRLNEQVPLDASVRLES